MSSRRHDILLLLVLTSGSWGCGSSATDPHSMILTRLSGTYTLMDVDGESPPTWVEMALMDEFLVADTLVLAEDGTFIWIHWFDPDSSRVFPVAVGSIGGQVRVIDDSSFVFDDRAGTTLGRGAMRADTIRTTSEDRLSSLGEHVWRHVRVEAPAAGNTSE